MSHLSPLVRNRAAPTHVPKDLTKDISDQFLPQMEEPIMILPQEEDLNATLDHDEEVHDNMLQSTEDRATKTMKDNEFLSLPQTEVLDPVLPQQMETEMLGLTQMEVIMPKVPTMAVLAALSKAEKDVAKLPKYTVHVQGYFSSLSIPDWCTSVPALHSDLPRDYACAVEKLFPVCLTGTFNVRDPCRARNQSHRR